MLKIFLFLSTLYSLSWGCLSCSYGDIKVLTHVYLNVSNNQLGNIDIEWTLDPMFSQIVLGDFDTNRNGTFETHEQYEVYKAILPMKEMGFFIRPIVNGKKIYLKTLKNFTVRQSKGLVIYRFSIPVSEAIDRAMRIELSYDTQAAFDNGIIYHLNPENVYVTPKKSVQLSTKFSTSKLSQGDVNKLFITLRPNPIALNSALGGDTQHRLEESGLSQSLRTLTEKIHTALVHAQEAPSINSIGAILLFSLLYGVLHAAGPGHGKTLVASYFTTNERSYLRGISIALLIAATHVISALLISLVLYGFVHTMFSQAISDVSLYTTRFSGLIILLIGLYLVRQKWNYYRPKPTHMTYTITSPHESSCGCRGCQTTSNSTDLMLILGAGIVPCPGTIIIFLFSLSLGMYTLGVLSAVVMSSGMGLTIALTAMLGTALRKKSQSAGKRVLKILDIIGVGIMLLAGIFLIIG